MSTLEAVPTLAEIKKGLARVSLGGFVKATIEGYQMGWVHKQICEELDQFLEAVVSKKSPRLMLTMPPRHGKSQLVSRSFPAYALGRYPDLSFIATSYGADLAIQNNRDIQKTIDSPEYMAIFPDTRLSSKNIVTTTVGNYLRNASIFEIVGHKGRYKCASIGAGITGLGGDILIVDDPVKDRAEADSLTYRENVWNWYTSTLYTRLAPGGGVLVINTRWHMDDLSGRLLEAERTGQGDSWRLINFPAIAEQDEPHRKAGEALHPERYPLEVLLNYKRAVGARDWAALYQQHPVPDGGAIFQKEWLKYYHVGKLPEAFDNVVISWDMTFKDCDTSDFVVGQVWGAKGADRYLLDQTRARMSFTETLQAFRRLAEKWPQARSKLVEDKANGPAVIDSLKHEVSGIIPIEPDGGKTARAYAVTPYFEAGNVLIPSPAECEWSGDYVSELLQFPSGAHDDQVDATTQALRYMERKKDWFKLLPDPPKGPRPSLFGQTTPSMRGLPAQGMPRRLGMM